MSDVDWPSARQRRGRRGERKEPHHYGSQASMVRDAAPFCLTFDRDRRYDDRKDAIMDLVVEDRSLSETSGLHLTGRTLLRKGNPFSAGALHRQEHYSKRIRRNIDADLSDDGTKGSISIDPEQAADDLDF